MTTQIKLKDLPADFKGFPKDRNGFIKEDELDMGQRLKLMRWKTAQKVALAGQEAQLKNMEIQMNSPTFIAKEIAKDEMDRMREMLDTFKEMGVNVQPEYGFSAHINMLIRVAKATHYSTEDNALAITQQYGMNPLTVEAVSDASGQAPYYSEKYDTIVPETPTDVAGLSKALCALSIELGFSGNVDTSTLTVENIDERNAVALAKAKQKQENTRVMAEKKHTMAFHSANEEGADDEIPAQELDIADAIENAGEELAPELPEQEEK